MRIRFIYPIMINVILLMVLPLNLEAQSGYESKSKSDTITKVRYYDQSQRSYSFQSRSHPRITWDFSRIVSEDSFEKEYTFEVEDDFKQFTINISGSCRSGSVTVEIVKPDGNSYSEVVINEYGNLSWRKSFRINDETKDRIGDWKLKVTASSATGSFRLNMQAY